ncbi:MAG: hypothetical protein ACTTI7_00280 [Gemella haemolysans]|uniref:hypothetical protein n=1 Tax=Gemella haemolysans TaxID=1379 RepID=UPI003F9FD31F
MSKQHFDYVKPIIEWGRDRGLLSKGDLDMQLEKSREESAELTKAITKYENGNKEALHEIKDAIGDVYVTIVLATKMKKHKTYDIFSKIKPFSKETTHLTARYYKDEAREQDGKTYKTFVSENSDLADIRNRMIEYVEFLNRVAKKYNLELVDCIELAYNTISKRTGKMIDGSFVKDK